MSKAGDDNKAQLLLILQSLFGIENVLREHRFHPVRLWRFDYAVPSIKLAVEYHGHSGFVGKGASGHSTIRGLTNDCEKSNHAHALGWTILAFTALHFRESERERHKLSTPQATIQGVKAVLEAKARPEAS